ncbi:MAG: ABC transporter permease [Opitutaceae bacterium]|nr:ABC transporter permease [Opitutaceae bacterium]
MSALRHALRSLLKTPGFTATAVATVALCLGANLALFAVVDAVLLRALPFPESDRLAILFNAYPGAGVERSAASIPNYFERRGAMPALASLSIYQDASFIVGDGSTPDRVEAARVSPEFFATLGTPLAQGRAFTEAELTYQTDQVAILTDEFWRHQFNGDPAVLGRTFLNDGLTITIVGVLPPGFRFLSSRAQYFRPAAHAPEERKIDSRHSNGWQMVARLSPKATLTDAQAQIDAFNTRLLVDGPVAQLVKDGGFHTTVASLHADHVRTIRPTLLLLQAGGLFLLVIGAVNLTNLLLIRASSRMKDLAVRQALGARRRHVALEVVTETTLLTLAGGLLGALLGSLGIDFLRYLGTDQMPLGAQIVFNSRLAAVGLGVSIVLGFVLAAPIVWYNLRARLAATLQTETRGGTTTRAALRLRHAFIVAQIALAFVLLSSAGLLGRSLHQILNTSSGFSPDHVLSGQVTLPWKNYQTPEARRAFVERLLPALRTIPGVTHAAVTDGLPFTQQTNDSATAVEDRPTEPGRPLRAHYLSSVSSDYWRAMKIPLLRGRLLEENDHLRKERVCVVDQAFAAQYWPGGDPIGRRIAQDIKVTDENACTIVGVVGEVKQGALTENNGHGAVYFPLRGAFGFSVILRTALPPEALAGAVRRAVLEIDPGQPIDDLRPLQARIDDSLVAHRSPAILAALFSGVALLLAALGTYGVLAYAVSQREREIGVRLALGAQPRQVLGQFLRQGAVLLVIGLLLGLGGTWAAGLAMRSLLFGIGPMNPTVLTSTAGVILGVVFFALYLPSRRAARTDPMVALRTE